MIKRVVVIFLFIQFSTGQDISSNWVNYDINTWRNMFTGYQSAELITDAPNTWKYKRAKGIYSNQYFSIINTVSFLGSTPYQQHVLIQDNNNQKFSASESYDSAERLLREMIKNIPSNELKMIATVRTSGTGGLKSESVGNPFRCYEFYDKNYNRTLIQICIVDVNNKYYVERFSYSKAGKYIRMFEEESPNNPEFTLALQAKLYYESSISPDKINSYNLKDYSEQFGFDLVAFHDTKIDLKTFGWFGDGYLQFKEINKKGVIGLANGMMENCIEKISIDPDEWQKASHYQRLWTVYHEIAHDIYNIKHGEGGPLMDAVMPADINYLDFYLAKIELMEYIKSMHPDDFECKRNSIPIKEARNYTLEVRPYFDNAPLKSLNINNRTTGDGMWGSDDGVYRIQVKRGDKLEFTWLGDANLIMTVYDEKTINLSVSEYGIKIIRENKQ